MTAVAGSDLLLLAAAGFSNRIALLDVVVDGKSVSSEAQPISCHIVEERLVTPVAGPPSIIQLGNVEDDAEPLAVMVWTFPLVCKP